MPQVFRAPVKQTFGAVSAQQILGALWQKKVLVPVRKVHRQTIPQLLVTTLGLNLNHPDLGGRPKRLPPVVNLLKAIRIEVIRRRVAGTMEMGVRVLQKVVANAGGTEVLRTIIIAPVETAEEEAVGQVGVVAPVEIRAAAEIRAAVEIVTATTEARKIIPVAVDVADKSEAMNRSSSMMQS